MLQIDNKNKSNKTNKKVNRITSNNNRKRMGSKENNNSINSNNNTNSNNKSNVLAFGIRNCHSQVNNEKVTFAFAASVGAKGEMLKLPGRRSALKWMGCA
ncbi:unnamed protein product, partial [Ceratitis capitata]